MELTTTQKRQRLLTMIFGAVAIFFTGYLKRQQEKLKKEPAILTYGRSISHT